MYMYFNLQTRFIYIFEMVNIDRLMQQRRNSIANALELRLSCINLSM